MNNRDQEPEIKLSRDEFTTRRRELEGHPEAVASSSRIDITDPYGNVATWVIDLYRVEGRTTALVQRGGPDGYIRMVIPSEVTAAIARHQAGLVTKQRRKTMKRVVADRKARGESVGNPDALKAYRKSKKR